MIDRKRAGSPLAALGWDESFDDSFDGHRALGRAPARVVAVHKETSIVRDESGDRAAVVSGRFRFDAFSPADYPAVGDWVALEPGPGAVIAAVLPRHSAISRSAGDGGRRGSGQLADEQVMAANVDVAFLIAGLDGDFNLRRMERYLAVAWSSEVSPVVVLNKADVATDLEGRLAAVQAVAPGVPILVLSARTGDGVDALLAHLAPGRTAVLLGSSGVGKSTLLNALLGESRQATAAVRESDSRGRHTTTHRELFPLPGGALLVDTPGIRSLEVAGAVEGIAPTFDDVEEIARACRFTDCAHAAEPGCAIQAALGDGRLTAERLASYRKLEREVAHDQRRADPRAAAESRRRWKVITKSVERQMERKYGEDGP
ncbi:MAG TPA: ribosome small subunit-dependent GTPase A [Vitreimonas sp.]|nr:ribosome small subunit-dependent GTPase A [Vitreimonas sp.]